MTIKNKMFKFCFLVLAICLLTSIAYAEDLEDIDPISFLKNHTPKESNLPGVNISEATEDPNAILPIQEISVQKAEGSNQQTQIISDATVTPIAEIGNGISHSLSTKPPTTDISRQLWQARISSTKDEKPSQNKNELQHLIKQIDSIEFKVQETPEPLIDVEKAPKSEPNTIPSDAKSANENKRKRSDMDISDETLQRLKDLSQNPEKLNNPFELAEILFNRHYLREAAKCYQESLNRIAANQADQLADKAWILFQIGNCLQHIDPATSMQMFRQLIAEYPDSSWTNFAKAKTKLIDWYLKDKPDTLINEYKSQAL